MAWTCAVCTFANRDDTTSRCSICETERGEALDLLRHERVTAQSKTAGVSPKISSNGNGNAQQASGNPPKATVQSTLFGSIATKKLEPKKAQKKKDVEKEASSPVPRQTHLLSSTQAAWACVAKDTPFDVLWANAQSKLNEIFKIKYMRYLQPAAVECALKRQSQLIIMATGGGKSLCYQLPAIVLGGTTIVVSPLIALMADQSQALLNKGISTAVISSANGERRNLDVMERMLGRSLRAKTKSDQDLRKPVTLVYCTPEQIQTVRFRNILTELHQKNRLALFAIDEAHCCSTWFQFRPAYAKLGWLRDNFPDVPVMACTATATPRVIQDIQATLRLENCPCRVGSFDRPNIRYSVRYKDDLDQVGRGAKGDLLDYLQRVHQKALKKSTRYSGIIYVHTRKDTNDLAAEITKKTGIVASAYHGGLAVANRDQVQKLWTSGKIQIAVATIAFGMGIDVAHVRYVIHWSLSKSMEAFYQESGRAGRDGLPSSSVLYYSKDDASKFTYFINKMNKSSKSSKKDNEKTEREALDDLQRMVDYCMIPGCRRKCLLQHFGERNVDPRTMCFDKCDFCLDPKAVEKAIDSATASNDFTYHVQSKAKPSWDGQWDHPAGENDQATKDTDWNVDGLDITGVRTFDGEADGATSRGKPSAEAVLSKFEALEDKGFVRFTSKKSSGASSTTRSIIVPEHIRAKLPDPLAQYNSKQAAPSVGKSSASLRDELSKLQANRLKLQAGSRKRSAPPPPPPPITFGYKKR